MLDRYQELLLQILKIDGAKPDISQFWAFQATDWEALIGTATRYRLACQVNDYLFAYPDIRALVPDKDIKSLARVVQTQLHYNFSQYQRLRRVLLACESANVPILLFKGLWLVEHVYRDPKARLSGDIDLLIQPNHTRQFTSVAKELGCDIPFGAADLQSLAPASNEYPLSFENNETLLDIHWAVTHPNLEEPVDETSIWARSEETIVGGGRCRTFRLEDHLLYLCFHAAIHHNFVYVGPRALLDIAQLIKKPPRQIDWEEFVGRAREFKWSRGVWLTLDLIREHLGVAPPEFVLRELQPEDPPSAYLRAIIIEALFLDQMHQDKIAANALSLINAPWCEKPRILIARLFPSRAEIATQFHIPIGSPGFYLNYLRRLRLTPRTHLPRILQVIFNDVDRKREKDRMLAIKHWLTG